MTKSSNTQIDPTHLVEEETIPGYKANNYYPVTIGQIFRDRYRTIGKLGYGSASTVWLCRDLCKSNQYVTLKAYINNSKVHRELPIYVHINGLKSQHEGRHFVRQLLDSFEIEGPHGKHICLIHQPLGISLGELNGLTPDGLFGVDLIRQTLRYVLVGLEFLHKEAHVIHTDLQPNNMLTGIHDDSVLAKFEQYEAEDPLPRKDLEDRTIYLSRPMPLTKGPPSLSDLSEARFGSAEYTGLIMPDVYRAPEVILSMEWSYSVDIWGFAMVLWDLFEPKRLFSLKDQSGRYSEEHHLAEMVAILGPPPRDFLQRSKKSQKFWDSDGNWKGEVPIPDISMEVAEQRLCGEEKARFLAFMRKMLRWKPEDRGDCEDVWYDEWFLGDLIKSGAIKRADE